MSQPKQTVLTLSHITHTYPGAPMPAVRDISVTFESGWCGIVGDNGCGKSTLARIACGQIKPDSGTVGPHGLLRVYCAQEVDDEPPMLADFACDFSPDAVRLRRALRIEDDMPWRFAYLSCGERKKIQVAVALWRDPDVLAVDEPTNHADAACREQIRAALAGFRGIGLLISHDRALLDALACRCLCFEGGRAVVRPGSYSQARAQAAIERTEAVRAHETARREAKRLHAEREKRAEAAARTASRRSARHLDVRDSDGRARRQLAIVSGQDGVRGRLAARMDERAQRAQDKARALHVEKRYEGGLWAHARVSKRSALVAIQARTIPCGPDRALCVPALVIGRTDHLGVCGSNGAGKSTLLRHIAHMACRPAETRTPIETLYLPQEINAAEASRLLSEIRALPACERGRLLSIVARLNSDPERILAGGAASPGEIRKLALARGILREVELIIADEPTNHLDIRSIEALEQAFAEFPGALIVVSHDDEFLRATVKSRIALDPHDGITICRITR